MKPLRVGFIGAGGINGVHAKALAKLPAVEIAAVSNHNRARAEAFSQTHTTGQAKIFDDWQAMLDTVPLDAVYIALPPGANVGQAEAAAAKGLHLMLEKPIALSVDRAESIERAVRSNGVLCQIGHHMRHAAPVRKLKQMLTDGTAGRPLMMKGRFLVNGLFPAWWRDPELGGGQLVEQAIHIYDLARHFLGEADVITAFADNLFHERFADYRVDDVSVSSIRFKNKAVASLCAANCYEPHAGSMSMTVLCEKVTVEFKNANEAKFAFHDGKKTEEIAKEAVGHETIKTEGSVYEELSANFIAAIRDGTPLRSGIEDGVGSLRLVLAAAASARAGGAPQRA